MNRKFLSEKGQGLVEYALIAVFVGMVVIGGLMAFGPNIKSIALSLMGSSGYSIDDGVLIVPGLGPTLTAVPTSTLPASTLPASTLPASTSTTAPTATSIPPTATATLACTPGSATAQNRNACIALSAQNNCMTFTYSAPTRLCSWP